MKNCVREERIKDLLFVFLISSFRRPRAQPITEIPFFPSLEKFDPLERFNALQFPPRIDLNRWILISIEEKMASVLSPARWEPVTVTTSLKKYLTHEYQWIEYHGMTWLDNLWRGNARKGAWYAPPRLIDWPASYEVGCIHSCKPKLYF